MKFFFFCHYWASEGTTFFYSGYLHRSTFWRGKKLEKSFSIPHIPSYLSNLPIFLFCFFFLIFSGSIWNDNVIKQHSL